MRSITTVAVLLAMLCGMAVAAETGEQAFATRKQTMREMGHALFIQIGKVAKGTLPYGPDTVQAAQTLNTLAGKIGTLFPPDSAVKGSKMNPDILKDPQKVETLAANVQSQTVLLLAAVKTGDLSKIGAAAQATGKSCNACHSQYRLKTAR